MNDARTYESARLAVRGCPRQALRIERVSDPSRCRDEGDGFWVASAKSTKLVRAMGSLIKKRRKRMRKKKHKKMLKRTRFQRRAAGK